MKESLIASINILGLAIIVVLFLNVYPKREILGKTYKTFILMMLSCAIALIFDTIIALLNGKVFNGSILISNLVCCIYFIFNPIPCLFWFLFVYQHNHKNDYPKKSILIALLIPIIIGTIISILSIKYDIYFQITSESVYTRGKFIYINMIISYLYVLLSIIDLIRFRKMIRRKNFISLLSFIILPLTASIVQLLFYGTSLMWPFFALGMLMVSNSIHNDLIKTDHLTQLENRRSLSAYVNRHVLNGHTKKTYAGIFLDIDKFKMINDTYGHLFGDQMLIDFSSILTNSFSREAFISRYGGDEFVIVCQIKDQNEILDALKKLTKNIEIYNKNYGKKCLLQVSYGYKIFNQNDLNTYDEFINYIDNKMYKQKEINHKNAERIDDKKAEIKKKKK